MEMNNELFWELKEDNKINIKLWYGETNTDTKEIVCFEYCSMFYIRITTTHRYKLDRRSECGKVYSMDTHNSYFKEFHNKDRANNYFKKAAEGTKRYF